MFQAKFSKTVTVISASAVVTLGVMGEAIAATFNPAPLFNNASSYSTTISANGNLADIYFPNPSDLRTGNYSFAIALLLQGALVDKSFYSDYANLVARYGFVVVVPNSTRVLPGGITGLAPSTSQVDAVLSQMAMENSSSTSPIAGLVNTQKLGLLGHSFGGAVGLTTIGNTCIVGFCDSPFVRPPELLAGAFFGTNLRNPVTQEFIPINNSGIAVALLQGDRDGRALPFRAKGTYDNIQTPPKALVTILGANHFGITNVNNPPGAIPDFISPTLEQDVAIETVGRWSGLFLRASMLNDPGARDYVYFSGDAIDPNVTVESEPIPESSSLLGLLALTVLATLWKKKKAPNESRKKRYL
jgi:Chlorophyllase